MRHAFATIPIALSVACIAFSAVPVGIESEVKLANKLSTRDEHLQPFTPEIFVDIRPYDCVASFHEEHTFSPEQHWCLIEVGDAYEVQVWTERSQLGQSDVPVPKTSKPIASELAQRIRQLWLRSVLQARYSPAPSTVTDATVVTFTVRRYAAEERLYAMTLSPISDHPPRWLADLGQAIFIAAMQDGLDSTSLSREVQRVTRKVEAFYRR